MKPNSIKFVFIYVFSLWVFLCSNSPILATDTASDSAQASTIETGTATAVANSVVETNVNLDSQSQLEVEIGQEPTPTPNPSPSPTSTPTTQVIDNTTSVVSTTSAVANTGDNIITASSSAASITTQNATAVANSVNLVNLELQNSEVVIYILNVASGSAEIIVLPRPELFQSSLASASATPISSENQAEVLSQTQALAITGSNLTTSNDSQIITGDAYAIAQQYNLINTNLDGLGAYYLSVNNPLTDFVLPACLSTVDTTILPSQTLISQSNFDNLFTSTENESPSYISNDATITNLVTATAITGNNQIQAQTASIITGISTAIANSVQFINTNINNSRLFLGIINFLGTWTGKAYFNYPDIGVVASVDRQEVLIGDTINLALTVTNHGFDIAHQPQLTVNFNHQTQRFSVSDLKPQDSATIIIPLATQSLDATTHSITVVAAIADPEINLVNNQASTSVATQIITAKASTQTQAQTTDSPASLPEIAITATNNTVDPVFPKDVITFEINIKNTSDYPALNSVFYHNIYDSTNQLVGSLNLPLGYLEPHFSGTIRFGVNVPSGNSWGDATSFHSQSYLISYSTDNQLIESNQATTFFKVKRYNLVFAPVVQAADNNLESDYSPVLGQTDTPTSQNSSIGLYLLSLVLSLKFLFNHRQFIS